MQSRSSILLKTAVAPVWSEHQGMNTNILFDEGAQRSFVTEELASKLDIKAEGTELINLSTFGNTSTRVQHLPKAIIYVEPIEGEKIPIEVLVVPTIANQITNYSANKTRDCKHLKGLRLAHRITNDNNFRISLLIGADFYWDFVEDTVIRGIGPTAVKSKLGYLLSGPTSPDVNRKSGLVGMFNILTNPKPEEFKIESLGEVDTKHEDENMYRKSSVEFHENRYVPKLPWKHDHETLPINVITKQRTDHVIEFHENRRDNRINIRVGDIVQVYDEKPRTRWKKAIFPDRQTLSARDQQRGPIKYSR
ncbi:Hypothetical predicted protein [Mytilus galloprovincialis]|nr:Hypothetical predicted protein [Mytilus galloprovincialis]